MKPLRQQAQELARPQPERAAFAEKVTQSLGPKAGQRVAELEAFAALTTHAKTVAAELVRWLPWNYHENLLSAVA